MKPHQHLIALAEAWIAWAPTAPSADAKVKAGVHALELFDAARDVAVGWATLEPIAEGGEEVVWRKTDTGQRYREMRVVRPPVRRAA